jgi:hypothetical protein
MYDFGKVKQLKDLQGLHDFSGFRDVFWELFEIFLKMFCFVAFCPLGILYRRVKSNFVKISI